MTAEDATAYTVLEVIIQRAYILGGINMSEHSTKFLTSLMLEVTGARSMLVSERKKWHSYLKAELKKLVRDREPLEHIVELPATPNLMQKEYPNQYAAAYPNGDVPIKVLGRWVVVASACLAVGLTRGRCSAARKKTSTQQRFCR